jgi:hypothetical protein
VLTSRSSNHHCSTSAIRRTIVDTVSRSTSLGDRCALRRGESITSTPSSVRSSRDCTAMPSVTSSLDRRTCAARGRPRLYPAPKARSPSRTDRSARSGRNFVIRA